MVVVAFLLWKITAAQETLFGCNTASVLKTPPPSFECTSLDDQTAFCFYEKSLCYSPERGFEILTFDKTKDGAPVQAYGVLNAAPFHEGWGAADFSAKGPQIFRPAGFPYRSFLPKRKAFRYISPGGHAAVPWACGTSAVLAFDAGNYNIYHWAANVFPAFLARLRYLEGVGSNRAPLAPTLGRLYQGRGFDAVYCLRGSPTDWQQNYADIALGQKQLGFTTYHYIDGQRAWTKRPICFERAVVAGAALYLGTGVTTAQLFREVATRLKGINILPPRAKAFSVTWFYRTDRRAVTNLEEAANLTRGFIQAFSERFYLRVKLDLVHWDSTESFVSQASQMGKTRVFITTHGSALNHCMFMREGGSVVEINGYQFRYSLDDVIVLLQGHYYFRYAASLAETQQPGHEFGSGPYLSWPSGRCNRNLKCLLARRDANVRLDPGRWKETFSLAFDSTVV